MWHAQRRKKKVYRSLVEISKGKRSLGRPKRKWKVRIKQDLNEIRCEDVEWIQVVEGSAQWWASVITGP
jgi:hypothetical protein